MLAFDGDLFAVFHLMIAGRLRWLPAGRKPPARIALVAFEFDHGTLVMTEAGSKRRASLHVVQGEAVLAGFDAGGLDPRTSDAATFAARLRQENHTLKRALTDPRILAGIGNAYSDEILWAARLSPIAMTAKLTDDELARLHASTRTVLQDWTERLRAESRDSFPDKVTAFHPAMAVHGTSGTSAAEPVEPMSMGKARSCTQSTTRESDGRSRRMRNSREGTLKPEPRIQSRAAFFMPWA